jgi:hypothetical protein
VAKTAALCLKWFSPAISGALLMTAFSGLPLVVCGTLKIAYDLALLFSFRHIKPPEESS